MLQPHCSRDLDKSVVLLEALDKNETEERVNQVAIAFTCLRVLDIIDVRYNRAEIKH